MRPGQAEPVYNPVTHALTEAGKQVVGFLATITQNNTNGTNTSAPGTFAPNGTHTPAPHDETKPFYTRPEVIVPSVLFTLGTLGLAVRNMYVNGSPFKFKKGTTGVNESSDLLNAATTPTETKKSLIDRARDWLPGNKKPTLATTVEPTDIEEGRPKTDSQGPKQ